MSEQHQEHSGDVKTVQRFVAFLGVYILLVSQFLAFSQEVVDGVPPYTMVGVVGVLIIISSQLITPKPFWLKVSLHPLFSERVFWIFAAILFSVLAAGATVLFSLYTRVNYIPVLTVWLLGAMSFVYAFLHTSTNIQPGTVVDWFRTNRNELLLVLVVTALAAAIRLYRLGDLPRVLDGDEGNIGTYALSTSTSALRNPFALWENLGALYLQAINLSLRFFGVNAFGLRLMAALGGIMAVPSSYLLARWLGGRRIAFIAAMILAFSHSHLHFSRIVSVTYIQDTWLIPLELYLLLSGLEKRESWRSAVGGILLALHYTIYLSSQIVTALVVVYMLVAALFYWAWFKQRIAQALAFWGGFVLTSLPSLIYIFRHPDEFLNRMNNAGTFQSGWLGMTMQATGQSVPEILFGRVVHAFLALFYYPAIDFYGSQAPMLSMISTVMFFAGLGIVLWRIRNPGYLLLNGYFWGATVAIGVFATPPSADSYRMLMALPAAVIMAAIGLDEILAMMGIGWKSMRNAYVFAAATVLVSLVIFNMWTYYADFAGRCRFAENQIGRFASYLGIRLDEIDNEHRVYLLSDDIFFFGSHASAQFLGKNQPAINFRDPVDMLDVVSGETIIASPPRIAELEEWARAHPGGQLHYEYDCEATILFSYQVP